VALRPNTGHDLFILEVFFLDHTQRRTTFGRTPLDEWSARRRVLYLITHNTYNRQISMPLVEFEPAISAGELPQTYALDSAATGTGTKLLLLLLPLALQPAIDFGLSNNTSPFCPIYHQLSPSPHSQHLKISFYFFSPSFPGSSSSSRPFQFLS